MPKPLREVNSFGGIDADTDSLLDACFQDHEAYMAAKEHRRFLIIGRKGSGKTAIFRKLTQEKLFNLFTAGHSFSDYPWHYHDAQAQLGVPEEERYVHSWKYLILLTASKILINLDQSQPWSANVTEDLEKLEAFVVDSYGSRNPDITQFFAPGRTLRIHPTFKLAFGAVEAGVSIERLPIDHLPKVVQELNRNITTSVIAALNPNNDYHICFDQLDLGFSATDPKYASRLTGLILAARDLSQQAAANGKRFSANVFLRDDIYQLLQFEDKNKLSENHMSLIEWDGEQTRWTLKKLMGRRFVEVVGVSETEAWDQVFDEEQEMRGRQKKYQHILDRTFRRPRDVIKFCNEILVAYKSPGHGTQTRFQNDDITKARAPYSEYLLNELDDEIFKHAPAYRLYIELLKQLGTLQFSKDDFIAVRNSRGDLFRNISNASHDEILAHLFEFSIIGCLRTGGGGGGSGYVWHYLDRRSHFDSSATSFRVHPGFKEILRLKQGGRGSNEDED